MPIHTETETDSKTLQYIKVVEGSFIGQDGSKFQAIEGTLERVWLQEDPGNLSARISPYLKMVVDISDETHIYRLQCHANITFGWCLATYLDGTEKGDWIKLKVAPGKDDKVSFPSIVKLDGENWVPAPKKDAPKGDAERLQFVREVIGHHSALYTKPEAPSQ